MMEFFSVPLSSWVLYALIAAIFYALMCRASHMDPSTAPAIVWQYRALCIGALASARVPVEWSAVCVCAGVLGQLLISSRGWPQADISRKHPKPSVERSAWLPVKE